jgi:hypothetical protein
MITDDTLQRSARLRHRAPLHRPWMDRHGRALVLLTLGACASVIVTAAAVWIGGRL